MLGFGTADMKPWLTTDLYAGVRYTDLDVDLELKLGVDDRDRNRKIKAIRRR